MIHELTGDLLLSQAHAIAHGIAPNDDFKQGLALALREQFPALYKDFRHWCKIASPKAGEAWAWSGVGANGKSVHVVSLLTQEPPQHAGGHAGPAKLSHLNHALHELKKLVVREGYTSLALPRLATGVGGLAWGEVEPLIRNVLGDLPIPVYVYATYQKGATAREYTETKPARRG